MISNFETVKLQLGELAEVVNKFTSEAVQLRIVEIVLGGKHHSPATAQASNEREAEEQAPKRKTKRKSRTVKKDPANGSEEAVEAPRSRRSGKSPQSTLTDLATTGFFSQPRTISDIVDHCREKLVLTFRTSDLSPALGRLVRNNTLDRAKNAEGQYEYQRK